jgi:AsmA protein
MKLSAVISGTGIPDSPELTGTITTNVFSPAMVIESIEADYRATDPAALTTMSFSADFRATPDRLDLDNLDINLDESELHGRLAVSGFDDPAIDFDLALDGIDIDRYLPLVEEEEEDLRQVRAGAALVLPVALFRDLNANGKFTADRLVAGGLQVEEIELEVSSTGNIVLVKPSAKLYGGTLDGTMQYTNLGDSEKLVISEIIEGVQLGGLLTDAGVTDRLSGSGSLGIDFDVTVAGGRQTILGSVKVLARDGALKGVDIKKILDQAEAAWKRMKGEDQGVQQASVNDETRFAELSGTFSFADLMVSNNDFQMKAPAFRISGKGDIDLMAEELDYLVSVSVVDSSEGQGGAERADLTGITIPVRFSGSLSNPDYSIDFQELIKLAAQGRLDEEREKFEEKLNEKLNESLNKLFR